MINGDKKTESTSRVGKAIKDVIGILASKLVPQPLGADPAPASILLALIAGFKIGRKSSRLADK